ncbi:hypothetical protein [Proteiniborus sp. MB09-C3]|uniref:hypothetical protein n=1 Tax=Proteiniborus sp. MB09-C3 TaxID=3050072 RepID=UPI002557AF13|nr:hypothetical protein [Proteiniborus sp. MB09-C3]WIV11525.1 hypothetical protein QO263_15700 [Proteiniborus sp. MB09-C3]
MNRNKKIVAIIICVFMISSIWTMLSLKKQVKNLQNEVGRMHSNFNNKIRTTNQYISNLGNKLVSKIEKSESLLSSLETETEYKNEQLAFTVRAVPKEKRTDEIIFLSLGDEKKEMVSTNGLDYTAIFALKMTQKIVPIISFESLAGMRQESLPEIYLDELLSLGYESRWGNQNNSTEKNEEILTLTVYVRDEKSYFLLNETPTVTIVIEDISTDTEIGRKEMQLTEADAKFNKELSSISFDVDLSEYRKKEGAHTVWLEMKTKGGIFYREEVASFDYDGKQSSFAGSGTGVLYPSW